MSYCKRTNIVEAYRFGDSVKPKWFLWGVKIEDITIISDEQATVAGKHCGIGQWIVRQGAGRYNVFGDEYFKKTYVDIGKGFAHG